MRDQQGDIQHKWYEDVLAIILGTLVVALGVTMYKQANFSTGGINGLALLLSYVTPWTFGVIFFALNLPFYWFAWQQLGVAFTLKTFAAVALLSLFAYLTPQWVDFSALNPFYAAICGGGLMGIGLLMLFRHKSGLGGINILVVYLQERFGIRAGYVQLAFDISILAVSFFVLSWEKALLSLLGAVVLNFVIALNFRPGRYVGFSGAFIAHQPHAKQSGEA